MFKKLNSFFFLSEEVSTSDKLWFYGGLGLMGAVFTYVCSNVLG